jgi:hypothetical protein
MRNQLRTHRSALIALVIVAIVWSLAGLLRGDIEAALIAWALPAAVLIGLAWEARQA